MTGTASAMTRPRLPGAFVHEEDTSEMTMTETPTTDQATPAVKADAEKSHAERFKFSEWLHVGEGAKDCKERFSGKCREEGHFHAWVRLPNPYQARDITEKAQAAKARRLRALRDPESDVRVILEDELHEVAQGAKTIIVDEIVDKSFNEDWMAAIREVDSLPDLDHTPTGDDGEEIPKLYANIDQDREEYERQKLLPEDQREEDFAELEKTLAEHARAVERELDELQKPRRERLMERNLNELIDVIRRDRIEDISTEAFLHTFFTWQAYVCTFKGTPTGTPHKRYWERIEQMKFEEPTEVINALRETFDRLETNLAASRRGKGS